MLELLQGKMSDQVMAVVTDRDEGLFPKKGEITLSCSCPDGAVMCKHVAAVLYGVGSRLDSQPGLLFSLRGVDAEELITAELAIPDTPSEVSSGALDDAQLGDIFGIDLDAEEASSQQPFADAKPNGRSRKPAKSKTNKSAKGSGHVAHGSPKRSSAKPNIRPILSAARRGTCARFISIATTSAPRRAASTANAPVPQPASRTRRPVRSSGNQASSVARIRSRPARTVARMPLTGASEVSLAQASEAVRSK